MSGMSDRQRGEVLPHSGPKGSPIIDKNGKRMVQSLSQNQLQDVPVPIVEVRRAVVKRTSIAAPGNSFDIRERSSRAQASRNHSVNLTDKLLNIYGPQLSVSRKYSGRVLKERERSISQISINKNHNRLPEIRSNRDLSRLRAE